MSFTHFKEGLIKSYSSFPRKREPSKLKALDSRFRGNDNLKRASLIRRPILATHKISVNEILISSIRHKMLDL